MGIHARQEQRCLCPQYPKTFTAPQGTGCARLRPAVAVVPLVGTVRAHGGPLHAIVAALGCDARTVAAWRARTGRQGQAVQASLVEPPRALGQVHADARRVKPQGGIGWLALAMRGKTRWWRAGEGSEPRAMALLRRLSERGRACALPRPWFVCPDGLGADLRARRETWRDPVHTGGPGRPRWRPWRNLGIAPGVQR